MVRKLCGDSEGNDAHPTTSLSHEQLHALARLVAQPFERRRGGLSQPAAALAGEAAQLDQPPSQPVGAVGALVD